MREIKLRAWVGDEQMIYLPLAGLGYFDFEGSYALSFVVDAYDGFWAHECYDKIKPKYILMQFTGLKDKNGKEIYEGDVLKTPALITPGYTLGVVDFYPDGCCYVKKYGINSFIRLDVRKGEVEVIGNVYENPELLNSEQNDKRSVATDAS